MIWNFGQTNLNYFSYLTGFSGPHTCVCGRGCTSNGPSALGCLSAFVEPWGPADDLPSLQGADMRPCPSFLLQLRAFALEPSQTVQTSDNLLHSQHLVPAFMWYCPSPEGLAGALSFRCCDWFRAVRCVADPSWWN